MKAYLHGACDAGSRLNFKFRSGTHGLNEELGRHKGREGRKECLLCDDECESVSHVLWDFLVYSVTLCVSCRSFLRMDLNILRAWIVFKNPLLFLVVREEDCSSMLDLVKIYIVTFGS